MARNIYVGGLPYDYTEGQLEALFTPFGQVDAARIVTDRMTGYSRGFGFVEMADTAAADRAIAQLNGTPVGGRTITVNEARPREERSNYGGRGGRGRW
jgi:RNA recognition motif-containing protein